MLPPDGPSVTQDQPLSRSPSSLLDSQVQERKLRPDDPQWLSPPNDDFPFFDGGLISAFQHDATEYSPVNAAYLADASLLAYSDPDIVKTCFARHGAPDAEFTVVPFVGGSTQGYVVYDAKKTIVAFRGTQVLEPRTGRSPASFFRDVDADRFQEVAKD
jgi:hypothetical protein